MNTVVSLPESLRELTQLKEPEIPGGQLRSLPDWIGNLSLLEKLVLRTNVMTALPDSIGNLSQLRDFDLKQNWLKSLPDSFGNLSRLQSLQLIDNARRYLMTKHVLFIQSAGEDAYEDDKKRIVPFKFDENTRQKLWSISEEQTSISIA